METNYELKEGQKDCMGSCSKCGSNNIEYDGMEVDGEFVWYKYECTDCGDCGQEHYVLEYCYSISDKDNN